eukprot:gb/GECG01015111.1/.p1 GENE.gb/GECG01015111.1/~~gb/GECG01015111.1/.p1  ORF type:complete len:170 (+),score=21.75 gb/GECG01015111.1/:1-510(+)
MPSLSESQKDELYHACVRGDENTVRAIFDDNIEVDPADVHYHGWRSEVTPVHYAAMFGHDNIVSLLMEKYHRGPTSDLKDVYGGTPLHDAAYDGHDSTVSLLVEKYKADVNAPKASGSFKGFTALHSAAHGGHQSTVKLLVEKFAANLHATDSVRPYQHWRGSLSTSIP